MTYVLVHGSMFTARFWDRATPLLPRPSLAVDLPGRRGNPADLTTVTVDDESASVVRDVVASGIDGPLTLVAHSAGALSVPGIVEGLDGQVDHVVLVAAAVPPEGGNGLDCLRPRHRDGLLAAMARAVERGVPPVTPGPPEDPEAYRTAFGGDPLDDDTLAYVVDDERSVVDTIHRVLQPVHWSRAGDVPVTYVLTERDRPVPARLQEEMVTRLPHPPTVIRLDTGHIPPVTDPEDFAALVAAVARAS